MAVLLSDSPTGEIRRAHGIPIDDTTIRWESEVARFFYPLHVWLDLAMVVECGGCWIIGERLVRVTGRYSVQIGYRCLLKFGSDTPGYIVSLCVLDARHLRWPMLWQTPGSKHGVKSWKETKRFFRLCDKVGMQDTYMYIDSPITLFMAIMLMVMIIINNRRVMAALIKLQ